MIVLCFPLPAEGHVNGTLGLSCALRSRGHKVVYAVERSQAGRFLKLGFDEAVYDEHRSEDIPAWEKVFERIMPLTRGPADDDGIGIHAAFFKRALQGDAMMDDQIDGIIKTLKPDVIIQDTWAVFAATIKAEVPVVYLCSMQALQPIAREGLPPFWAGYSFLNPDESKWKEYRQRREERLLPVWKETNAYLESKGAKPLEYMRFICKSEMNIVLYPKILVDLYLKGKPLGEEYHCVDHCLRPCTEKFEIPENLRDLPGKLILVSMGSIGNQDVERMKILVDILGRTKHRYIVNTGPYHDRYKLAPNMWGAPWLPQLAVLQVIDLFITHGGNNSFTESLYYGKPMVVMPFFTDQHDNAVMAEEGKLGAKFYPYQDPKEDLPIKIEMVLNSEEIKRNVEKVSKSIQESNSLSEAVMKIEALLDRRNNNFKKEIN